MAKEKDQNVDTKTTDAQALDIEALKAQLMEEMKAESAKLMEEAKAKADEVVAQAKAEAENLLAKAGGGPSVIPETKEQKEEAEKLVTIRLFKDKDKYKNDVTVIHNGKAWRIKRGVEVQVPYKIAQIVKQSDIQRGVAADVIDGFKDEYEQAKDRL